MFCFYFVLYLCYSLLRFSLRCFLAIFPIEILRTSPLHCKVFPTKNAQRKSWKLWITQSTSCTFWNITMWSFSSSQVNYCHGEWHSLYLFHSFHMKNGAKKRSFAMEKLKSYESDREKSFPIFSESPSHTSPRDTKDDTTKWNAMQVFQ